jgi:outer membrane lipoprotein-sorting protein
MTGREIPRRGFVALAASLITVVGTRARAGADEERVRLEGASLDALLADIAKTRKTMKSLRANFTQERKLSLLATTVKSTGELIYLAPERLRWELAPPDDVIYFVGPEGLSYKTKSSRATLPAQGANVARALTDVRALLGGDLASLRDRYTLAGSRGPNDVEVSGAAKEKTASVRAFSLFLDKGLIVPTRARLLEGKSDTIDLVFSNATVNGPVDPAQLKP